MASLVLGAAGAIVGSFFGMPMLGFMIGSAIGSALEKPKGQDGPRLTDLHNQNSQYGLMIPICYGTVRIAGNVIWMPDKVEHSHKSSGKGGSGPQTYTYTQSFAIMFCEGPVLGVLRIWANKRLIWSAAGGQELGDFPFVFYNGTTSQLPDPTMEADKGVGHVPAHRGRCYMVITDLALENFGNAAPSIEAEILATGTADLDQVNVWSSVPEPTIQFRSGPIAGVTFDGTFLYFSDYGNSTAPGDYTRNKYAYDGTFIETTVALSYSSPNPAGDFSFEINPVLNSAAAALTSHDVGGTSIKSYWFYDGAVCSAELTAATGASGDPVHGNGVQFGGFVYAIGGSPTFVAKWNAPEGVPDGSIAAFNFISDDTNPKTNIPSYNSVAVANDGTVWIIGTSTTSGSGPVWHLDADLNLIFFWAETVTGMPFAGGTGASFTVWNNYFVFNSGGGGIALWLYDGGSTFAQVDIETGAGIANACLDLGGGYFLTSVGIWRIPAPTNLKAIVDDLSFRAGLASGEYQTDTLTQRVNGYVISNQSDVRSCLEPVLTAYFADGVESGPAIKFVNRGAAPDETILSDDLAAALEGEDPPPDVDVTRIQEADLPRAINITYWDKDADYQIATQLAQRETTLSTTETSITFPLVLTAKEAKQIADIILYDTWAKRRKITFTTSRKWSTLEPTDVKTVAGYTLVITQRDEGQAGVLKFDAVATRSQIFAQSAVGAPSTGFTPTTPPTKQASQLLMLDIPLIGDADFPNGVYAAMAGATKPAWAGAELDKSIDGGTTYSPIAASITPDVIGATASVLGDFLGGNQTDNVNSVDIVVGPGGGALASTTDDGLLNGANEYLIGDELVNAKTATLTGPGAYTLTGLLRGRRGTEWAMGSHASPERFVVMPVQTNVNAPFAELGASRKYKAVTSGSALSSATAVDFTNTGIALRPYAPVQLGGGRNAANDIILTWTRRTRIGGAWLDFVDVPLSEDVEAYKVTYFTDGTYGAEQYNVVVFAPTATVTAADQTTFFGGLQNPFYWTVQQIGSYSLGVAARGAT